MLAQPSPSDQGLPAYHVALSADTGTGCSLLIENIIIYLVKKAIIGFLLPRDLGCQKLLCSVYCTQLWKGEQREQVSPGRNLSALPVELEL